MVSTENQKPEAKASLKDVRLSPQRARLVIDLIRGKQVENALRILDFNATKGARIISKLLRSAIVNAREVNKADVDNLVVSKAWVDGAKTLKRFTPRARGSAGPILKRSSHITLVLSER